MNITKKQIEKLSPQTIVYSIKKRGSKINNYIGFIVTYAVKLNNTTITTKKTIELDYQDTIHYFSNN